MLGKLIKYELKSTYRIILPLLGVLLGYSLIHWFFYNERMFRALEGANGWVMGLIYTALILLYVVLVLGLAVVILVVAIQRFYKNLLSDEGYLMFTLPVKPWQHILCKVLVAGFWNLLAYLAIMVSIALPLSGFLRSMDISAEAKELMGYLFEEFTRAIGMDPSLLALEWLIIGGIEIIAFSLPIYAAISIGQLWQRHRILGAIGAYIGMTLVYEVLGSIVFLAIANSYSQWLYNPDLSDMNRLMLAGFGMSLAYNILCFFIANVILTRRLNLE